MLNKSISIFILSLAVILIIIPLDSIAYDELGKAPVIRDIPEYKIGEMTRRHIEYISDDSLKVWIYFNDKGVYTQNEFDTLASHINLEAAAEKRRNRAGVDGIRFVDLPVYAKYLDALRDAGVEIKRISRWLNAVSVIIARDDLDRVASLPFVNRIALVAKFHRNPVKVDETAVLLDDFDKSQPDYGYSFFQNDMINIPSLHDQGYTGMGVIIAIFDTGFRKTHIAFGRIFEYNRVLAEYDFVFDDSETQDEPGVDIPGQHNHGTYTWSAMAGYIPGQLIGPAYDASFVLAKTEDIGFENQTEEDNWVAAMEWADSIGVDIISSSLSYSNWYDYEDFDGNTAVISIAANIAYDLGINVVSSAGNKGPDPGTVTAPADAFNIISVGAVDWSDTVVDFSSRGPTYDGRIKPEVCALGWQTRCAGVIDDSSVIGVSGTSLSAPLVSGAIGVILSGNQVLTPYQLRQALLRTAGNSHSPDNNQGWGIVNALDAFNWGANFYADTTIGPAPLEVRFYDSSDPEPLNGWTWDFGDGDQAFVKNPVKTYTEPGIYDVSLTVQTIGTLTRVKHNYIAVLPAEYLRGDVDFSGRINLLDITFLIDFLYRNGTTPTPYETGDVNSDGTIDLLDIVYLVEYVYFNGPPPPPL